MTLLQPARYSTCRSLHALASALRVTSLSTSLSVEVEKGEGGVCSGIKEEEEEEKREEKEDEKKEEEEE